jgi:hypothetical protein
MIGSAPFSPLGFSPEACKRGTRARLETAADKPRLTSSLRTRRCLILADGYYGCRINFAILTCQRKTYARGCRLPPNPGVHVLPFPPNSLGLGNGATMSAILISCPAIMRRCDASY